MDKLIRPAALCLTLFLIAMFAVYPPSSKLRQGKDLRGGTTLVYAVELDPGAANAREVMGQTIEVLKNRVDPNGLLEVQMVAQGTDRIEVTMPLPNDEVKGLKEAFEDALKEVGTTGITPGELERAVRAAEGDREARLAELARGDAEMPERLAGAAELYDAVTSLAGQLAAVRDNPEVDEATKFDLADAVARAQVAYEEARDAIASERLDPEAVRSALRLSDEARFLKDDLDEFEEIPSERRDALDAIKAAHPEAADRIDAAEAAYIAFEAKRQGLDDEDDLTRLIAAAGVPSFRITVDPAGTSSNTYQGEAEVRAALREKGPLNAGNRSVRWCKINDVMKFAGGPETLANYDALRQNPVGYFSGRGFVGEEYNGEYWILCWATNNASLTQQQGSWAVAAAFRTSDDLGRPAVGFRMDALGASRLGGLTRDNVGNKMAVLLDEQVYTAPYLRAAISQQGVIEGDFTATEIDYIIRVLTAGSLQARVSPEPLSRNTIAPEFGAENLRSGAFAGLVALGLVSAFMIAYYWVYGVIAVLSLLFNAILILGAMALARASFTLPGIAGVILTFGMAVDANVLIFERVREELRRGLELRVASKVGYEKALSAIIDGNVTNLIVCVILGNLGTQEVKGFAITLGIGVVGTMISALIFAKLLQTLLVDVAKVKKLHMLPTALPAIERVLEPKINWMGLRFVFMAVSSAGILLGLSMVVFRGGEMLDAEFRGGVQATLTFRDDLEQRATKQDVADSLELYIATERQRLVTEIDSASAEDAPGLRRRDEALGDLATAEIIPIDPAADGVTADAFVLKTYVTSEELVIETIGSALADFLRSEPPLRFTGLEAQEAIGGGAPVYAVTSATLGENLGRPTFRDNVSDYLGGVAILLEDIQPRPTLDSLITRLDQARGSEGFTDTLVRPREVRVLDGTPDAVRTALVLVAAEGISVLENRDLWQGEVAEREWSLVQRALRDTTQLASVQSFSPVIAERFQQTAIVSVILSLLLILIYIWVRFGSVRYSLAAILTLTHDVLVVVGLIAVAEVLYEGELTQPIVRLLAIEPFKIDLNLVAAILTIIGYSLNDTIVIMDRIRENRGRLSYATRDVVNRSINETISRTVITSGTTFLAALVLYIFGGEGVKAFAYALLVGVFFGTYSSIAIASPLVWSQKASGETVSEKPSEPDAPRLA